MTLLHATLADGTTALFRPDEFVWSADYAFRATESVEVHGAKKDYASELKPGRYWFSMGHCCEPRADKPVGKILRLRDVQCED